MLSAGVALLAILNNEPELERFLDVLTNDDHAMLSAVTLYEAMLIAGVRGRSNQITSPTSLRHWRRPKRGAPFESLQPTVRS